jgi:hypothetical protein
MALFFISFGRPVSGVYLSLVVGRRSMYSAQSRCRFGAGTIPYRVSSGSPVQQIGYASTPGWNTRQEKELDMCGSLVAPEHPASP